MRIDTTRKCEDCGRVLLRNEDGICEDCEEDWEPLIFDKEAMERMEDTVAYRSNVFGGDHE